MSSFSKLLRKVEIQHPGHTYAVDHWAAPDLVPMDKTRRTWGGLEYGVFWATGGFAIYNYTTGSALIGYGLDAKQALAVGVISPILLSILCVICGWPGTTHHIPYAVVCRSSWGMRGSWFAIAFRILPGFIWGGIEAFWGGQAVATWIGTMSIAWAEWDYPLANGYLQLKDFIGFLIYYVFFLLAMWWPPQKLQRPFQVACASFVIVIFGLLIWAVHNGGSGPYFAPDYVPVTPYGGSNWALAYGATALLTGGGIVALSLPDWTRYAANGPKAPLSVMSVACPIFIYLAYALGIIITSASAAVVGEPIWQPYLLMRAIQAHHGNSASARAGIWFASLTTAYVQVFINIILNSVAGSMDMAAYSPKFINIRRGAYFIAAVGLATNPWNITESAASFIVALSGFGIFYGPCAGILIADFWIVRQRRYKIDDLYRGNSESIYWYTWGVNWRAFAAFAIGLAPSMPGYIMACQDLEAAQPNGWMNYTRLGFITGCLITGTCFVLFNKFFPPRGLGEGTLGHDEDTLVLPSAYRQDIPTQGQYSNPVVEAETASSTALDTVITGNEKQREAYPA